MRSQTKVLPHAEEVDTRQPSASAVHVVSVFESGQDVPAAVHAVLVWHVHFATPALPVQVWRAPQAVDEAA